MHDPKVIIDLLDEMDAAYARAVGPHPGMTIGERLDLWHGYDQAAANRFAVVAKAYRELVKQLDTTPPSWIATIERLPERNGRYAIIYTQGAVRKEFIADYDDFYGWNCKLPNVEITHWLKLPDTPNA